MLPAVLNETAVLKLLPHIDVQQSLREMFAELAANRAVQPEQTVTLFPNAKGDFISYQGVLEKNQVFGAKLSPYIVNDANPTVTAWTCLMSMETGQPLLLCDSAILTKERTAGTTAVAVDLLSQRDSTSLAIVGSGSIALAHWQHAHEVSPEFLNQAQVYCDYRETTPNSAGEMVIAKRKNSWTIDDIVGDLPELVSKQCRLPTQGSPVFFRSLGLGLEDIAIAYEIYGAYSKQQGI